MSAPKFTPGPWSFYAADESDGALIAAAPELYDALEQAETFLLEHFGHADAPYVAFAHTVINAAAAALARARGEVK